MESHVLHRREVVRKLPIANASVYRWTQRGGGLPVRLGPRPVGWTRMPWSVAHRPTLGHILEHPVDANPGDASGLSRDASTQVATSRTVPPHADDGGHAVPRVPSAVATRAPRRCAHGARMRDEARARRESTRRRRSSCAERAVSVSRRGSPE